MYEVYSTPQFEAEYTYSGSDLGATWTPEKTLFRLWAPTAQEVTINLYPTGDPNSQAILRQIPMQHTHHSKDCLDGNNLRYESGFCFL